MAPRKVGFQAAQPEPTDDTCAAMARDLASALDGAAITPLGEGVLHNAILSCGLDPHNTACGLVHLRLVEIVNGEIKLGPLARALVEQWTIAAT